MISKDQECDFSLTVREALTRPLFKDARVIAGEKGLDRRIRWVHILEISHFDSLIHGEEMILSTGVGIHHGSVTQEESNDETHYVKKLIDHGASCLCLELGTYIHSVPQEMIRLANRHDFPLIVFDRTVRFVDITQDLHSLIINHHHQMLQNLEQLSHELHQLTLGSHSTNNILKRLHERTGARVVYHSREGHFTFVPAVNHHRTIMQNWCRQIEQYGGNVKSENAEEAGQMKQWRSGSHTFLLQPIYAMGQTWGELVFILENRQPQEFDFLALDRASTAIAQDIMRKMYIEERKRYTENRWVDEIIHGEEKNEHQIRRMIASRLHNSSPFRYRICLMEWNTESGREQDEPMRMHTFLHVRNAFEQNGFQPFMTGRENLFVILAVDSDSSHSHRDRLKRTLDLIRQQLEGQYEEGPKIQLVCGRCYQQLTDAPHSYEEAQLVLKVNRQLQQSKALGPNHMFYEDIGVYRLLLQMNEDQIIQSFIEDYLGPLIRYDRRKGGHLLETLKVYLENDGSKKQSAEELFVVRQTLYHRLQKIEDLLGDDFMKPEKRLAIEVALRAYPLFYSDS